MELATADAIVLVLVALFALRGAFKGFAWQAVRTFGLVAAIVVANLFYERLAGWFAAHVSGLPFKSPVSWVLIAVGVFVVVGLFAYMARGYVRAARLGAADRTLGFALGGAMGFLVATLGFGLYASFRDDASLRESLAGAHSVRWMAAAVQAVKPLAPEPIRDHWIHVLDSLDDVAGP